MPFGEIEILRNQQRGALRTEMAGGSFMPGQVKTIAGSGGATMYPSLSAMSGTARPGVGIQGPWYGGQGGSFGATGGGAGAGGAQENYRQTQNQAINRQLSAIEKLRAEITGSPVYGQLGQSVSQGLADPSAGYAGAARGELAQNIGSLGQSAQQREGQIGESLAQRGMGRSGLYGSQIQDLERSRLAAQAHMMSGTERDIATRAASDRQAAQGAGMNYLGMMGNLGGQYINQQGQVLGNIQYTPIPQVQGAGPEQQAIQRLQQELERLRAQGVGGQVPGAGAQSTDPWGPQGSPWGTPTTGGGSDLWGGQSPFAPAPPQPGDPGFYDPYNPVPQGGYPGFAPPQQGPNLQGLYGPGYAPQQGSPQTGNIQQGPGQGMYDPYNTNQALLWG